MVDSMEQELQDFKGSLSNKTGVIRDRPRRDSSFQKTVDELNADA